MLFILAILANSRMNPSIIPLPNSVKWNDDEFVLNENHVIFYDESVPRLLDAALYLADFIHKSTRFTTEVTSSNTDSGILLVKSPVQLDDEEYNLHVTNKSVTIVASSYSGFFYGVQTLLQLFPPEIFKKGFTNHVKWTVPGCDIIDKPRL